MKNMIGIIALALSVPAIAQTAPAADPNNCHSHPQAAQGQQQGEHSMDDMPKECRDMMKRHAKAHRKAKTEAEKMDAEVNGNGHQGHNH